MQHIHLKSCPSTQIYLRENLQDLLKNDPQVLVSCSKQTDGIGRNEKDWQHFDNALAFSCTYSPKLPAGLRSLAVGLALSEFFPEALLKWPNDLLTKKYEKCGGILCHDVKGVMIAGIGINIGSVPTFGSLYPERNLSESEKEEIPRAIYDFLLNFSLRDIAKRWNQKCAHLDGKVQINEDRGIFLGITEFGEARLQTKAGVKNISSGSLILGGDFVKSKKALS